MEKTIIWDLDNTLYFETDEYKNKLNEATALAAINDLSEDIRNELDDIYLALSQLAAKTKRENNIRKIGFKQNT